MAQNPFRLLELMQKAFGKRFVNQIVGTKTNVVKPQRFDESAPTKAVYNPKAFENDKTSNILDTSIITKKEFWDKDLENNLSNILKRYKKNSNASK